MVWLWLNQEKNKNPVVEEIDRLDKISHEQLKDNEIQNQNQTVIYKKKRKLTKRNKITKKKNNESL